VGAVYFYHLTEQRLDQTLPVLLGKARGQGWRVAVRGRSMDQLTALDTALWQGDGFDPHAMAGGPHDAAQPVLLTTQNTAANDPDCLMCIDGAEITATEVPGYKRACVLFDGNDDAALNTARNQWKTLTDAGCAAQYWAQSSGRWEKKAEKGT